MISMDDGSVKLAWRPPDLTERVFWWVLRMQDEGRWNTLVLPGTQYRLIVTGGADNQPPTTVAISAVDRLGNVSEPRVLRVDGE